MNHSTPHTSNQLTDQLFVHPHDTLLDSGSKCSTPSPLSYDFHLRAVKVSENKFLICQQPTTKDGRVAYMMLSKTFILNDKHCLQWKIEGVNYYETNALHIVYVAQGIGFDGRIEVAVPREWD